MWKTKIFVSIFLVIWYNITDAQRVLPIGSEIRPSASGVDYVNVTFLLDTAVSGDGVLFAFSAYFRTFSAVRLQIWRPIANDSNTLLFELISQVRVIPAGIFQREDVYIESKLTEKCTRVQEGDRLGLYVEEVPGSITYTFIPKKASTLSATSPIEANATYSTGLNMMFDKLTFPYEFSLAAYIDTNMSHYTDPNELHPECPRGLMIPQYVVQPQGTSGPSVVNGEPGDTGATGPMGDTGERGEIGAVGPMGFTGATGPVGPTGTIGMRGQPGINGTDGQDGSYGATGFTGPHGKNGIPGIPGSPGSPGPPGVVKSVTPDPKSFGLTQKEHYLLDPMVILGIIIWLIIVTLLIIVVLIILIWLLYMHKKKEKEKARRDHIEGRTQKTLKNNSFLFVDGNSSLGNNNDQHWMQKMKEEVESQYKMDTITDHRKQSNTKSQFKSIEDDRQNDKHNSGFGKLELYGDANDLNHRNSLSKSGAINSIYKNLDLSNYEVKNY